MSAPNVLAQRYASLEMQAIRAPQAKVRLEREFWVAVLEVQQRLGMVRGGVEVLADYRRVLDDVDLASIQRREVVTRHDVKARLEEFNSLAGHEALHQGLTSRDLTENVEQLQIRRALLLVRGRMVAVLCRLAERAASFESMVMVARTHNVAAQPTTLGKRLATVGTELLLGLDRIESLLARYPLRGLKGPVGSQQDLLDLAGGAEATVVALEREIATGLGFDALLDSVGQVYPRSLDFDVVSALFQASSASGNLALSLRLMAGHELVTEGFREGQVGSSAMPHKMNTRSCERVNGLVDVLRGYVVMAAGLVGNQWNEGDVSCSVVRRVMLPDAFYSFDGLLETTLEVVRDFGPYPAVIGAELERYLPFLATTRLLMAALRAGMGREEAHEVIRDHAVVVARAQRETAAMGNDLARRLGEDPRYPLNVEQTEAEIHATASETGRAKAQVDAFVQEAGLWAARYPVDAAYRGGTVI